MEVLNSITQQTKSKESITSKKISNLILAVSALALSVVGGCNKPQQGGSDNRTPALHLSCVSHGNSLERINQVSNISNIKLTQDMKGTNCTYYTEDMYKAGNQVPVTVSCNPKENNKGTVSRKIDGVTIKVVQSDTICEILNK